MKFKCHADRLNAAYDKLPSYIGRMRGDLDRMEAEFQTRSTPIRQFVANEVRNARQIARAQEERTMFTQNDLDDLLEEVADDIDDIAEEGINLSEYNDWDIRR